MEVFTLAARPDLEDRLWDPTRSWPRFMLQDPIADLYYSELNRWSEHALIGVMDGTVVARGLSVAFAMGDEARPVLPPDGWDRMIRWSYLDGLTGRAATHASAVEVSITPEAQGTGLASHMVRSMIANVDRLGFGQLLAPVRPSAKSDEPGTPMAEYVGRLRPDGLPEDPWMRVHARLGATTIDICPRSMTISGTLGEWRDWTGEPFDASGNVNVPGGLVPVHVDVEQDHAVYVEPNVWMEHRWDAPPSIANS